MYTFEYQFFPKSMEDTEVDKFDSEMQWFISSLYKNGQILRDYQNTVRLNDSYQYRVVALEKISLERKLYNKYSEEFFQSVLELSAKPLYYFMFKYYSKNRKECSCCGDSWENSNQKYRYDYVCHRCRLVSEDMG
ncbi:DUF2310 family Zn-ribbon-containing protein [Anaerosporobacter sp.]|uniref:DUF2310 family Zn-ribbon-containing protein n=1 Tax=Anaerosporobacter sp. TaxID=1872529 RepID=UPI00286EDBC5|nr:DUF2310 family Zn-ribbon-containing protein [Anaerosporobacter sp.]